MGGDTENTFVSDRVEVALRCVWAVGISYFDVTVYLIYTYRCVWASRLSELGDNISYAIYDVSYTSLSMYICSMNFL